MKISPSMQQLLQENKRLKKELAALKSEQSPISIDPNKGTIKVRDYRTDRFTVERMDAYSPGIKDAASGVAEVETWMKLGRKNTLPDLQDSLQAKVTVNDLKLTIPYRSINKILPEVAGEKLESAGVRSLLLRKGEGPNDIDIKGRVKKFIETDFSARGELQVSPTGKAKFRLKETRVAGLPMPNFLAGLAARIFAGETMREMGVSHDGQDFVLDPAKMMPENIESPLTRIRVGEEGFIIEGGRHLSQAT